MSPEPDRQHSLRYIAAALLSAVLGNAILIGGDALGIWYAGLVLVSWFVTGTLAYTLHAIFTFQAGMAVGSWLRFMAGNALSVPAWMLVVGFGKTMGWPMALCAPLATIVMFAYNYINARLAILRRFAQFNPAK
jgi:hypothetical protein